ncbi:penicillin amidase [Solimonas aquatica]|uniref:Penicillin amidase n=1 Tax=Solimonas aquatica TaxID=489703 RepID=A0A1H9CF76_9GAMM|nr:penicillin acylase family protein [Solimonas aquatica]SEP99809.1 penicillin amidase [Solimonas aquatica]
MRLFAKLSLGLLAGLSLGALGIDLCLRSSLPQLDGEHALASLQAPVQLQRDALGIVTIHGEQRLDLARATGFAHAQDRYFQMDLLRRNAAGETAALLGPAALPLDRQRRFFRMRAAAVAAVQALPDEERALLDAYVDGVNQGLQALRSRPFEYWLLRQQPQAWRPEDSLLVLMTMFFSLSDARGERELALSALRENLPAELLRFLTPKGTPWDAPLQGQADTESAAIPPPQVYDLRSLKKSSFPQLSWAERSAPDPGFHRGSNNWALAGAHVAGGGALVSGDMHLDYRVPHIWYRLRLQSDSGLDLSGVSLPGVPFMIAGSNRHIAWALTTTYGDWSDLVALELDPADPTRYRTPQGWRRFTHQHEILRQRQGADEALDIDETIWGPVIRDARGRAYAVHWLARVPGAVNLHCRQLESARRVQDALDIVHLCGLPPQNFVAGDAQGHIAWSVAGRIPHRVASDGSTPLSWAEQEHWQGFLDPARYPQVLDPPQGRVWSANARMVDGEALRLIGTGNYALGARQQQIRDDLLAIEQARPQDMLAVQLDDRALFLHRWQQRLLSLLTPAALAGQPLRAQARTLIEHWGAHAAPESVGYRLVNEWRTQMHDAVFAALLAPCRAANADCRYGAPMFQSEGPLWQLITQQPLHLLNPRYENWDALLLAALDAVITPYAQQPGGLAARSWGERNTLSMRHALSPALGPLARWLDMPAVPMAGDNQMPRVQTAHGGASQRMAVTPGREEEGYLNMPGGQSGHPLSPFYSAGHQDWIEDRPTPFLPGKPKHQLRLLPAAAGTS